MKRKSSLIIIACTLLLVLLGFYLKKSYLDHNSWITKNIRLRATTELIELESVSSSDVVYALELNLQNKGQKNLQLKIVDSAGEIQKLISISPRSATDRIKFDWYENKVKLLLQKDDTSDCDIIISYQFLSFNKE